LQNQNKELLDQVQTIQKEKQKLESKLKEYRKTLYEVDEANENLRKENEFYKNSKSKMELENNELRQTLNQSHRS